MVFTQHLPFLILAGDARGKETLATEQAKAASKEQLAKAMKDLCYATLLSSLLGFFGHMGISMKNWTLKIWEKNNL